MNGLLTMSAEQLTAAANTAASALVAQAHVDGVIDVALAKKLSCYRVIAGSKGLFGRVFDWLMPKSENALVWVVVSVPLNQARSADPAGKNQFIEEAKP